MKDITFYTTMRPSNHYVSHPFDNYVSVVVATDVYDHILISVNNRVEWIHVSI